MRRSRLAAARAGHVRKRGPALWAPAECGSPRGPHLMVSTSMVYGCIIDVFNTEDISAECSGEKPRHAPGFPAFTALRSAGGESGCWGYVSRSLFRGFAAKGASLWDGWGAWLLRQLIPHHKLPSAYLRERLLVLHLQLLFQGGVEFPTGGKSGGVKGTPWSRRGACD